MCDNEPEPKERIARDLGWDSYDAAPAPVRNNIDAKIEGPIVKDPFAPLRRGQED